MWQKVKDIKEIPIGDWVVIMEDGKKGYMKAVQGGNSLVYVVNGAFAFDRSPVIAYTPFPSYPENLGDEE